MVWNWRAQRTMFGESKQEGFTFIEIAIGLLIIGILMAMLIPRGMQYVNQSRRLKTEDALRTIKLAITQFHSDVGQYPNVLEDLVFKPSDAKIAPRWRGPYVTELELEKDAWGNPFMYRRTAGGARKYELYSFGAGGESAAQDDWIDGWNV